MTVPQGYGVLTIGGVFNSSAPTPQSGQQVPLQLDSAGHLMVNVAAGGGSGGTSSTFGVAFPGTGTAVGATDGTNMQPLNVDGSGNLKVNIVAGSSSGIQFADAAASGAHPTGTQIMVWSKGTTTEYAATGRLLTNAQSLDVSIVDGSGNQITSFGGGTQFADNAASGAAPTGTLSMGWDAGNLKVRALTVDSFQSLRVNIASQAQDLIVDQGVPAAKANAWPIVITDNTNVLGTATHPLRVDPTGTTTQPVSLASTTITGTVAVTQSTSPWIVAGAKTPADAYANPTDAEDTFALLAGWDATNSNWRRVQVDAATGTLKVDGSGVTQPVSGTVTANQGGAPWTVKPDGTVWTLTGTSANVNVTNTVTVSGTVTANQGGAPWSQNLTQVASTALGATAVVNFGTAPAAVVVPAVNASLFSGTTGLTNTSGALDVNIKSSGATVTVSGTVTANQGGAPWTVKPDGTVWTLTGTSANVNVTNTVTVSGTVTANQGTANATPWNENVAQFGGNAVVTGTGASGTGIPRVTVSNDSNVLVTQSTSPWVDNVSQFGGNNVVTGTGLSGAGIPRVTVSSDSFPASQTNGALETGGNLDIIRMREQMLLMALVAQQESLFSTQAPAGFAPRELPLFLGGF